MLNTRQPMLLFWGADWTQFYNDAFVPSFGVGKHPAAMGQSARECWADAWPVIGAQLEAVVTRGEPAWYEDALVPILRNGRMEEVFWTYSYSPAYDDERTIRGVLVIVTEMTGRVLAARRLAALSRLSITLARTTSEEQIVEALFSLARELPQDLPVVTVREQAHARRWSTQEIPDDDLRDDVHELATPIAIDVWPEPVTHAFGVTMRPLSLTFGLSPRLPFDASYRDFLSQVAQHIQAAATRVVAEREQLRSDEERKAMLAALEQANRAKDEFLAMLGHELRNPLAPIVAALELMKSKDPNPTAERAAIERQVHHVVRLVDDLLDVSRISRGQLELQRSQLDVADIVAIAVEHTAQLVRQRTHELAIDVERGLIVNGDLTRLAQVIANLLVNAARYTPPGGKLRVWARRNANDILIEVSDTGKGITPELAPRIFDLFVQGKRNPDRAEGGLGIGLAVVKNLVAVHGGSVAVTSDGEDKGSTFTVRLPADTTAADHIAAPVITPIIAGKRVLLVDDNEDAAHLLGEVARTRGHEVAIAHHPTVALELVQSFVPDIAVLDIGLPTMDGYELGKRIRARHPNCRIVALTGYGQANDRQRSADAGFIAHLLKPVRVDVLLELLH
jgi:signal transduction histidine kinase